jgi:hypothetical protein
MHRVLLLQEAEVERAKLVKKDRAAVDHAIEKLEALGTDLSFPHASAVKGHHDLRELRPQAGKSPWRPLYRQLGDAFVIADIAPEAKKNKRGFDRACLAAVDRLSHVELGDEAAQEGEPDDRPGQSTDTGP